MKRNKRVRKEINGDKNRHSHKKKRDRGERGVKKWILISDKDAEE